MLCTDTSVGIDLEEMKGLERKMLLEAAMALKEPNQEPVLTHHLATPMHVAAAKEYIDVLRSARTVHTCTRTFSRTYCTYVHAA